VNIIFFFYKLYIELLFELKRAKLIRIISVRGLVHVSFLNHQENVTVVYLRGFLVVWTVIVVWQGFVGHLNDGLVQWSVVDSDFALIDRVKCLVEGYW